MLQKYPSPNKKKAYNQTLEFQFKVNDVLETLKHIFFTKDDKKLGAKDADLLNRFSKTYPKYLDTDFK